MCGWCLLARTSLCKGILFYLSNEVYCLMCMKIKFNIWWIFLQDSDWWLVNHWLAMMLRFFIFQCKCGTWPRQTIIAFLTFECVVYLTKINYQTSDWALLQNSEVYQGWPLSPMLFFPSSTSDLIYYQSSIFKFEKNRMRFSCIKAKISVEVPPV